jgi:hypothetical protein
MKRVALILWSVVACACPDSKPVQKPGSGSDVTPPVAGGCDGIKAKVEGLYRAEAQTKEPKRVDGAVADNTAMVMNDCKKDPGRVSACVGKVSTVAELEAKCLKQLDDEGTEGNELKK